MKSTTFKLALAAGLFLAPTLALQAQVDSIVNLNLRCYYQEKSSSNTTSDSGKTGIVRLDSKQLLSLLSKQVGIQYPRGSRLKIAVDGSVYVADSSGRVLGNVSKYFTASTLGDDALFDGKRNTETNEERSHYYYPIVFTIKLPALQAKVSGIVSEDFSVSRVDRDGVQISKGNGNSDISGKGTVNNKQAYYLGDMKLEGREAKIVR